MSDHVVYECGHCDGKGVCHRGVNGSSCSSCLNSSDINFRTVEVNNGNAVVNCSRCNGTGRIVQKLD